MALETGDLQKIAEFFKSEVSSIEERLLSVVEQRLGSEPAAPVTPAAETPRTAVVGVPDVDPEAGPDYYVHLADGSVVVSKDSVSTHMTGEDGSPVQVIGRYQKGQ